MDREKELSLYTTPNFLIPLFLQPDGVNFWWVKLRLFVLTDFIVGNIKGLRYYLDYQSLKKIKDCIDIPVLKVYCNIVHAKFIKMKNGT